MSASGARAGRLPVLLSAVRFASWWVALDVSRRFGMAPRFLYARFYDGVASLLASFGGGAAFMNYGYADCGEASASGADEDVDRASATSLALYRRTATAAGTIDLGGKDVLEVGAGLGGGAAWLAKSLAPRRMVAVDLSGAAVRRGRARYLPCPNLSFEQRDAQDLAFGSDSFDLVLNVESSHTYPDFSRFVSEALRVLRPGGHLMLADFRPAGRVAALREALGAAGAFDVVDFEDITSNVVEALRLSSRTKEERIATLGLPASIERQIGYFAGLVGSEKFARFERRDDVYARAVMRKR